MSSSSNSSSNSSSTNSSNIIHDMFYLNTQRFPPEINNRITNNALLFPISKAFLEMHPQYYDIINTYEAAVDTIPEMLEKDKDSIADTFIPINETKIMHLKINITNAGLYGPNSQEAVEYGNVNNMLTPKIALAKQGTYSLWLIGDINYSYIIIDKRQLSQTNNYTDELTGYISLLKPENYTSGNVPKGYIVGIPLMLGSKWCSLRNFDYGSLIRSGEEMSGFYGTFIIEGYIRYLIPCLKKPMNKPIVIHNEFDKQLSRVEIQYSRNTHDYQNSYYMVGAMLQPAAIKTEANRHGIECHEFGFSLQLNAPTMNIIARNGKIKELINFIPIKILFAAFGCTTDKALIDYVCPDHSNIGLINAIKMAVLYGPRHYDAYVKAQIIPQHTDQGYIKLPEKMTKFLARYIIGMNIMRDDDIEDLKRRANGNEQEFRLLIKLNVDSILESRFMPAIGDPETGSNVDRDVAICVTLGNIFNKLYIVGIDKSQEQSKQSLTNKRFYCGQSFVKEFKAFHNFRLHQELIPTIKTIIANPDRKDLDNDIANTFIQSSKKMSFDQTRSMVTSFKSAETVDSKFSNEILEPKNQLFIWNKLREVRKNAVVRKRDVRESWENLRPHPSEMFFLCPTESPDSANVMKLRALGVHCRVTVISPTKPVLEYLHKNDKFRKVIDGSKIKEYYTVSVNGSIVGYLHEYDHVEKTYEELMNLRRNGTIANDTTIILNHILGELNIWCDAGRLSTIFVIVDNCFNISGNKITIKSEFKKWLEECDKKIGKFQEGIEKGFIEFLDCEMISNNCVIAACIRDFYENPLKYTHVALSSSMDGIIAAANPCGSLNVGIRAGMSTNHLKQAMGYPLSKYPQLSFINNMDILVAAQQQIIQPIIYRYLHIDQVPIGQNVTICFCQFKYNQDDSVIFNRESVENGLLKCDTFTTFKSNTIKSDEKFQVPTAKTVESLKGNPFSYEKLGTNSCLPKEISSTINTNDVLIGKIKVIDDEVGIADISEINKMPDAIHTANPRPMRCVEKHYIHENSPHFKMLVTGEYRILIPGDKINQEQAQKGTIGKVIDAECLPYTSTGKRADVYFNPISVFKRKTYGCIYLAMLMKIAMLYGCFLENSGYGTCRTPEEMLEIIQKMCIDDCGFETMYDPETGKEIPGKIFFGVTYYERQHHLVETKINIRARGAKDPIYNQPTRGKRVGGGLTVDGKLSLNAINAAGINYLSKDFHLNQCSKMIVGFCKICHNVTCYRITHENNNGRFIQKYHDWRCPCCGRHDQIKPRLVSCSFPLLNHIFNGLHLELKYYEE